MYGLPSSASNLAPRAPVGVVGSPRAREAHATAAAEAFAAHDRQRLQRLESQLSARAAEALRVLPLLLHVNQSGLPGYVDDPQCPCGIADYSPSPPELRAAERLFAGYAPRRVGVLRPFVDLVALMGSAGTVGFSEDSDLDVWVCYAGPAASGSSLEMYRRKVSAVERWVRAHGGLEAHLFLQPTEGVRADDFGETGGEGCGSALGALLKEEFYRTGVLLAGKAPFWRLVPPGSSPHEYRAHREALRSSRTFPAGRYVDLGPVTQLPLGEFFGAAVWQIVKGWKAPFKSALKMGLLEQAVRSGEAGTPLCERVKEAVLAGGPADPYQALFEQVLGYYRANGEPAIEDLLARCFYLKAGLRLSPDEGEEPAGDRGSAAALRRCVRDLGWGPRKIRHLDDFASWRFEWVRGLARELDRFFLRAYQRIREVLEGAGEAQRITPRDLTILGAKLRAAYRKAPDKVETLQFVTRGVQETSLSLYQEVEPDGEAPWSLYRGWVSPLNVDAREANRLRTSDDPVELLAWAAQNRILGATTRVSSHAVGSGFAAAELEAAGHALVRFAAGNEGDASQGELLSPSRPLRMLLLSGFSGSEGEMSLLQGTTWGETYYRRWQGPEALRCFLEQAFVPFLLEAPARARVEVFAPNRKGGTPGGGQRQLQRELPEIASYLGRADHPEGVRRRHVGLLVGQGGYVLDRWGPRDIRCRAFPDPATLLRHLVAIGPHERVETRVEGASDELAALKAVFEHSSQGLVDVFVAEEREQEVLYVVDEVGNLFHTARVSEGAPYALAKLLLFLEGVIPCLAAEPGSPLAGRGMDAVRIHTLLPGAPWRVLTATHEYLRRVRALGLRPVGLEIERVGEGGEYRIAWGERQIDSESFENPLAEVRDRIRESRRSGLDYDVFVTRLFLDEAFRVQSCGRFATVGHYLFYKRAVEQRLAV